MKTIICACAALLVLALFAGTSICCMGKSEPPQKGKVKSLPGTSAAKPGEILVKFKPAVSEKRIGEIAQKEGLEIIKVISPPSLYLLKTRETSPALVNKRISDLKKYDDVEYVEPNYIYKPARN